MPNSRYLLGTHAEELERLRFQHQLWLPSAQAAWERVGLKAGDHVLDLGAGPGFAAMDLARAVGPAGRVVGLELSADYVTSGRALANAAGLSQLELRQCNLLKDPWPQERFTLIWCRWVAMFLSPLEPLLDGLERCIEPGGQVLMHEYVHWDSFGLHPHGQAVARFGKACQDSFRQAGGDPDVNRRLPALLATRGWRIENLNPLPVLGGHNSMAAQWLQNFVAVYATRLEALGLWTSRDTAEAQREIAEAATDPGSFWMGPTLLELKAAR